MKTYLTLVVLAALTAASIGCSKDPEPNSDMGGVGADTSPPDQGEPGDDVGADANITREGITIDGLSGPVTVAYDQYGAVHIDCETALDCFRAEGYVHAADRFLQMDLIRHQTRGRLSLMLGYLLGEESDKLFRSAMATWEGEPLIEKYFELSNDETKAVFRAYSEGVNAWLVDAKSGTNGALFSEEYSSGLTYGMDEIPAWEPEDSVALLMQFGWQFTAIGYDAEMTNAFATLGPDVAGDIFAGSAVINSSIIQSPSQNLLSSLPGNPSVDRISKIAAHKTSLRSLSKRLASVPSVLFGQNFLGEGSNNWAAGSANTAGGGALLSSDPHLNMTNPATWYIVKMVARDGSLDIGGASIPASPGVILGHNKNVAWGATVAILDVADQYLETLTPDGLAVMRNGERVELIRKTVVLPGRGGATREAELEWVPDHGPLMEKNMDTLTGIAVKWVGQDPAEDLNFLVELLGATNVTEARDALSHLGSVNQNWLLADTEGSIAWLPAGRVPDRSAWVSTELPAWMALPADGSAEWGPYVPVADLPQLHNPPSGFIATTNNDFNGAWDDGDNTNDGPTPFQTWLPAGPDYRHARVLELLGQSSEHTLESFDKIGLDTKSVHATFIVPSLIAAADESAASLSPEAAEVLEALREWDYFCPTGLDGYTEDAGPSVDAAERLSAVGCAAFHTVLFYLTYAVFEDDLQDVDLSYIWMQKGLAHLFSDPSRLTLGDSYFDNNSTADVVETRGDIVSTSLQLAGEYLVGRYESSQRSDWLWGRIHQVRLPGIIDIPANEHGTFANSGGYQTVRMADPRPGDGLGNTAGSSYRFVYKLDGDGVEARFAVPGGTTHRRDSDRYMNMLDTWLKEELSPLLPLDEIEATSSFEIQPASPQGD